MESSQRNRDAHRAGGSLAMMLTLADSRLPVGGHVHSGGLEQAITDRLVTGVDSLREFLIRRAATAGLVGASIAAAVADGRLTPADAEIETDARTPSPAARTASQTQGRGMLRLAKGTWPQHDWSAHRARPHLPVITGSVGAVTGLGGFETALVYLYSGQTGAATAGQRLLALDPGDVAGLGVELVGLYESLAARAADGLADVSDPDFDILAQRHEIRDMPLFAS